MITTPEEFDALLAQARAGMERLLQTYPDNDALKSAQRQLAHVAEWTRGGGRPTREQIERLSFGLIAAREIETLDMPLADQLHELSYYLDHLR